VKPRALRRCPEAEVIGRPALQLHDADREAVADALADFLLMALDNDRGYVKPITDAAP
jgi:hypothetical protein